jgi:thermitase
MNVNMNRRRITISFCLCVLTLAGGMLATLRPVRAGGGGRGYMQGEIVVKLYSAGDLAGVAADFGLDPNPRKQFGSRPIYVLRITDREDAPDKARRMAKDSRVQYVEPNHRYSAPEGQKRSSWARVENVTDYAEQWAAAKIHLPEAHTTGRGAGVIVAVMDTGVDATHSALAGHLVSGFDFVDMDADPSEVGVPDVDSVYGHGTHVAGIVALTAPEAKIMPVRVLDRNGEGNIWVLAEALRYAVNPDGNLATDDGATVINMSLGTDQRTAFLDDIINLVTCSNNSSASSGHDMRLPNGVTMGTDDKPEECLSRSGAVIVAAAGNDGSTAKEYPAAEDSEGLLAVAATTQDDVRASYSNFGSWVQIGAPGDAILSTVPGNQWGAWSGTSMATPFVAGVAALVQSGDAGLTPDDVTRRIVNTADRISGEVRLRVDAAAALGVTVEEPSSTPVLYLPMLSRRTR